MNRISKIKFAPAVFIAAVAAAALAGGCKDASSSSSSSSDPPSSTPIQPKSKEAAKAMKPTTVPALKSTDLTHTVAEGAPYYVSMPMGEATPAGTFTSGAKVLVMTPGTKYSKVVTEGGEVLYAATKDLEAMGK